MRTDSERNANAMPPHPTHAHTEESKKEEAKKLDSDYKVFWDMRDKILSL